VSTSPDDYVPNFEIESHVRVPVPEQDVTTGVIRIRVAKNDLPPGAVLLEDAASLASGVHDAVARLVQHRLGYVQRGKLRTEAKQLSPIVLVGVSSGSGILECRALELGLHGRNPAIIAATEIVEAVNTFAATGAWPTTLPPVVRNRIGAALRPVMTPATAVEFSVAENGHATTCHIDSGIEEALQAPETFSLTEAVELIGRVVSIDVRSNTLKLQAAGRTISVPFTEAQFSQVDPLRWQRAYISGVPADIRLKKLTSIVEIRAAASDEEDGVIVPSEVLRGENTAAFRAVSERLDVLSCLKENWNSYGSSAPHTATVKFSRSFIRDVAAVLVDYGVDAPVPFVAPTPSGGIQFEWAVGSRELELEIARPNSFHYLRVSGADEEEGSASRWEAVRFVKWVATGEEP
jgi:hypothetical protein